MGADERQAFETISRLRRSCEWVPGRGHRQRERLVERRRVGNRRGWY